MKTECPSCGSSFTNASNHWEQSSSCDFPEFTEKQKEIVTGVLMGDGSVSKPGRNPQLIVAMINKEYLKHISSKLSPYGNKVKLSRTAEQSAKRMRERGFRPNAKEENYSDVYRMNSRTTPELNEFLEWYESGNKKFPKDIKMTPTVLKHWFVCDGTYVTDGGKDRIEISAVNEEGRYDNIVSSLKHVGLNAKVSGNTIYFSNSETDSVFQYMGEPVPGFKRKWPNN